MSSHLDPVTGPLKEEQIIPDVIPESFTPSVLFTIIYRGKEVLLGSQVPRDDTLDEPDVKITPLALPSEGMNATYTLVMTDPDAPSRADPKFGQWRHWVVTGVSIAAPKEASEAAELVALKPKAASTPYWPPGPPPGSGLHRYTFLLFEEPAGSITIPADAPENQAEFEKRRRWNAIKFAEEYNLKLVGATFFLTQANEE
ncbi:phosphatidylethanolamine-binding protein [Coprinopsis sp. MPI-PUGE-AT-0042]|nr:phosphatidylethanolamine-binding protein [Coprinopsis sp. MPI-PUGE-AT-0042]